MKTLCKSHINYYTKKDKCCGKCNFYEEGKNPFYGWCSHPKNRIPPNSVFPGGVMPSRKMDFFCELYEEDFQLKD